MHGAVCGDPCAAFAGGGGARCGRYASHTTGASGTDEPIVGVLVPEIMDDGVDVQFIPQERVRRTLQH